MVLAMPATATKVSAKSKDIAGVSVKVRPSTARKLDRIRGIYHNMSRSAMIEVLVQNWEETPDEKQLMALRRIE